MSDIRVADNPAGGKFEITLDGEEAGLIAYERSGATISLIHTLIDPRFEGRGLGTRLVREALDSLRAQGLAVLPQCPFVRGYIQRHREYADLVPAAERPRFDLTD